MAGDGGGRRAPDATGLDTSTTTTPLPSRTTTTVVILAQQPDRVVIELADLRARRISRIDGQSGPWWPWWRCCWSWTAAEASRRAG